MEDVFKRVEDVSNRKTGTGRIRGVQIIPQFSFFLLKAQIKAYTFSTIPVWGGWVGGVLPYMGYTGMCHCEGYSFQAVYSRCGWRRPKKKKKKKGEETKLRGVCRNRLG